MKTLIFSDTHLTHKFDKVLFDYIAKLVKNADQVVINGDFWDAYITTFDKFCKSEWNKLFPILKKKNTIYLFGNHDKKRTMDKRMDLFSSIQNDSHEINLKDITLNIQHGHLISPELDGMWLFRNDNLVRPLYKLFAYFYHTNHFFSVFVDKFHQNGQSKKLLDGMISFVEENINEKYVYIFGHTHIFYKDDNLGMYSCGVLDKAQYSYIMIEDDKIKTYKCKSLE